MKSPTAFAIITDSVTLSKCSEEFHAYKQALEDEGLGTYIISADWKSPEEVKAEILALAGKKPRLEGVVLAGDADRQSASGPASYHCIQDERGSLANGRIISGIRQVL